MPYLSYTDWNPRGDSLTLVEKAVEILVSPEFRSYNLTLRQLYYQFVARDIIPNTQKSYDRLGEIISKARLSGMLDWNDITDNVRGVGLWAFSSDDPVDCIRDAPGSFYVDTWTNQPERVEVWVEKDALSNVVSRACQRRDVTYFSCRGYVSSSAMWRAAQRIGGYLDAGQPTTILHLGDHDPSGLDMTRDITERMELFLETDWKTRHYYGAMPAFTVKRVALNMDQIRQYEPPPNPAKMSDARAASYVEQYGYESWELDSLSPSVLAQLIDVEIEALVDAALYEERMDTTRAGRRKLEKLVDRWDDVEAYLDELED